MSRTPTRSIEAPLFAIVLALLGALLASCGGKCSGECCNCADDNNKPVPSMCDKGLTFKLYCSQQSGGVCLPPASYFCAKDTTAQCSVQFPG